MSQPSSESEVQRFEASYIQLLQHTSIEITKLKSFIRALQTNESKTELPSHNINLDNHALELSIYRHMEPMDDAYIEQRMEILRESKLALIKLTSFEMNRLRDIIKHSSSNLGNETPSISTVESDATTPPTDAYDIAHATTAPTDAYDIAHPLSLRPLTQTPSNAIAHGYVWTEIEKHNKREDLWVVHQNKIFDITEFLPFHPGGSDVIVEMALRNQDITNALKNMNHPPIVESIMRKHYIGNVLSLSNTKPTARKRKDSFSTVQPMWDAVQHNLNVRLSDEAYADKDALVVWDETYSVRVDILDKQHEDLVSIINDLYHTFELRDALQLLDRWDVHCKTEEALFFYYKMDQNTQMGHVTDHKKMYYAIKDQITDLRIKYNHEKRVCHELIDFAQQFAKMFKRHHFEYDVQCSNIYAN
eukprot:43682_1